MDGSKNLIQGGWKGGGGGSRADCQKTALTLFFGAYFGPLLILRFTVDNQWFISKKTIVFQGFRGAATFSRGGGQLFPGQGVQLFRGGGGSKCKFLWNPIDLVIF